MIPRAAQLARVGMRGTDSLQLVDAEHAKGLKAAGIDFVCQYLGDVTSEGVDGILSAGLAFVPVTFADKWDGNAAVGQLRALGMPPGVTAWLDIEGKALMAQEPTGMIAAIDEWAKWVIGAGYEAGVYVGSPQPFTGDELYALKATRYWKAPSEVRDRHGVLVSPHCGFCMYQLWDSQTVAGVWSDFDFIQKDNQDRLPTLCVAGPSNDVVAAAA